jgi:hypothetical protein
MLESVVPELLAVPAHATRRSTRISAANVTSSADVGSLALPFQRKKGAHGPMTSTITPTSHHTDEADSFVYDIDELLQKEPGKVN